MNQAMNQAFGVIQIDNIEKIPAKEVTLTVSSPSDKDVEATLSHYVINDRIDMAKFFKFSHLPDTLKNASRPFALLALHILQKSPGCAERTVALRKLLEAKDANVRTFVE